MAWQAARVAVGILGAVTLAAGFSELWRLIAARLARSGSSADLRPPLP
jgi:hypothetical protein